ncbi:sugar nucleotide-binding protein [Paucibacter sp. PLA-PC-4]|uniref:sugar nucleotide-binding protein n=1 Tax=Paucibacter sp. PLA-PC-4 TaxID=2993655 RepID=UPI00224AFFFB|nr:sugar nucleotide-binding protein [Paucibacter sp. PLA-PC-4]MCX2864687.1 sugar nucleotide-binding protein [Paucibacter sp. PLA-PC-4]
MRCLITGLRGTLAPVLARQLREAGHELLGWDREQVDPEDAAAASAWLAAQRLDAIAHLAMGSADWAGRLAAHAAARGLPMLFTSTAMVFHHEPDGPHGPQDQRTALDVYGRYKIASEDAVRAACTEATVARIGWQIDAERPGNNMLMALDDWQRREGRVSASAAWRPACSFMDDTAAALMGLLLRPEPGVVHLDSNADEAHGFDRVAAALRARFGRADWRIEVHQDYRHDQRLAGGQRRMPGLSERLPELLSA